MAHDAELSEFLAALTSYQSEEAAVRSGLLRIAEVFDAEVAALVSDGAVLRAFGFARDDRREEDVLRVAAGESASIALKSLGECAAIATKVGEDPEVRLVVARSSGAIGPGEVTPLKSMGRILVLTLRLLANASAERELREMTELRTQEAERRLRDQLAQRELLESLLAVQRLISHRLPLQEILEAVADEARTRLAADAVVATVEGVDGTEDIFVSAGTPDGTSLVGSPAGAKACGLWATPLADALDAPRVLRIGAPGADRSEALVLSAPILEGDRALGALHAVWTDDGPIEAATAAEAFKAFAGHAAMAISDASTVNELNHAFHDPLTGLPNRSLFLDRLEHAVARARRTGERAALLFIDLNGFKTINDTLGHAEGDQVLRIIGGRISACTRGHESAGRLGGDEFAVLLEDATQESALEVANRILATLREASIVTDGRAAIGASIGIALTGHDCDTGDELLRRADIAMYNVKSTGESAAAVYRGHMGRSRMDHRATEAALERALAEDQFVVHYQPIVSLSSRMPVGVEALIRWRHPDRGLMEPAEFIPDAERSGMIVDVGRWVLQEVSRQCVRWRSAAEHTRNLTVSVNLSGYQVLDGLATHVTEALDSSGLEPSGLVLEVTESIFLGDLEAAGACLNEARSLGVRLALDDFGTGYSSLNYIQRFPFEQLKIDRSFVRGIGGAVNGVALVKTIVELGQRLGMTTIAEGIERPIELAQLRSMRCTLGQGFLFSHPAEASAVTELLLLVPTAAAGLAGAVAPADAERSARP